jgi:hypothetical protein
LEQEFQKRRYPKTGGGKGVGRNLMKKVSYIAFLVLTAGLLASCASGTKFSAMQSSMPACNPDMGRVFFYRTAVIAPAIRPPIVVTGANYNQQVWKAKANGFFYQDLPPGSYTADIKMSVADNVSFTLDKGQTRFIKLNVIPVTILARHFYLELVDEQAGLKEIADCEYTGQP